MTCTTARGAVLAVAFAALAVSAAAEVRPSSPPPPPPPEIKPGTKFKPGSGFTLAQGEDFSLQVTGRLQARYTYTEFDDDRTQEDTSQFTPQRVRFGAKGTVAQHWKFELQADFGKSARAPYGMGPGTSGTTNNTGGSSIVATTAGAGSVTLRDALISYSRTPELAVTAGQFKVRFDRQEYVSSGRQLFVDRSLATRTFGYSRDVGVMLDGAPFDRKLQWNVGIFEGEPLNGAPNANTGHSYVGRLSFNPNGDFGILESDIKKTDYHLWYVDVAGAWNADVFADRAPAGGRNDRQEGTGELTDTNTYTFGFGYKHAGFYFAGEYFDRSTEVNTAPKTDTDSDGWYAQMGYTIVRDKWEVAARYAEIDPNDDAEDDAQKEYQLGLNRYFKGLGHALKLNNDLTWFRQEQVSDPDLKDLIFRSQLQIVF